MKKNNNDIVSIKAMFLIMIIPFLSIMFFYGFNIVDNELAVRFIMRIVLFGIFAYAFWMKIKKEFTIDKALRLIIISGIVMRLGYMLYTNWYTRVHDVGGLDENDVGHASYIINNILRGHLPNSNEYQFYHPPLYHILSAVAIKIAAVLNNTDDYKSLIKYAMSVSCAASCLTLVVAQKLADELKINRKYQIISMIIMSFYPNMILMGGRVNNDALVTMFVFMSVYFTVKWFYETKMKWIIGIALSIGFGIMTKISCGVISFFTGAVMIYKLFLGFRDKKFVSIIDQLMIFGMICFPIALLYPIRNYIMFGQPFNYVLDLGVGCWTYVGDVPFYKRFLFMPLLEELKQPFMNSGIDYNIFMIVTRTAVFGEWEYQGVSNVISMGLYFVNLLLIVLSLYFMIYVCINDKSKDWFSKYSMFVLWIIMILSFLYFNIKYPHSCTADMRYIPFAVASCCIYTSKAYGLYEAGDVKLKNFLSLNSLVVIIYVIMVIFMYS